MFFVEDVCDLDLFFLIEVGLFVFFGSFVDGVFVGLGVFIGLFDGFKSDNY